MKYTKKNALKNEIHTHTHTSSQIPEERKHMLFFSNSTYFSVIKHRKSAAWKRQKSRPRKSSPIAAAFPASLPAEICQQADKFYIKNGQKRGHTLLHSPTTGLWQGEICLA